ncbi:MAG: pyruvate dehydrogenase (acetyl-transferring), homodimeric type, partial [Leptospiraceae bacterium]|nr:pyruvate dehydrogenase (acetyl-transferring), homodimeric type [Leptospiraceae bacterium]
RRDDLGGVLPSRRTKSISLTIPGLEEFSGLLTSSGNKELSTTMAFVRMLNILLKDKELGKRIVPIVPDESRTFGMEGLFRQIGIWSHVGQLYTPQDKDQLMFYKEDQKGQVLQEGINEAGAMSDWIAAATSYSTHGTPMIPFFIFYSMFGFQRVGDLCWAAGDIRSRGFLLGGTSGRTTLNGEGLQHEDGHSHIWSASIPNCISYDPTFSYEVAVIIQNGLKRMYADQEDIFYYITVMNENYSHPEMPVGVEADILKGMYLFSESKAKDSKLHVQLLGSGSIFREVIEAADLLQTDWGVSSDIWGCPSFTELGRDWIDVSRKNLLNPEEQKSISHVEKCLQDRKGPVIASTDYVRMFAEQIRPAIQNVGKRYSVLGTEGFGRSDTREKLREFFEVDRYWVTITALKALADEGAIEPKKVKEAIQKYGIDINKPNPLTV